MTGGKWGTWALVVSESQAGQQTGQSRLEAAVLELARANPNLERVPDIVVPLSSDAREAARAARALAEVDVVIADVTGAKGDVLFFLGVRDLIKDRVTIALHEGAPSDDLMRILGKRLIPIDADNPAAAQASVAAAVKTDAVSDIMESDFRRRLGAYRVSRVSQPLDKASDEDLSRYRWKVTPADGGEAPGAEVGLWWGDIAAIVADDGIHALVNSENTYFEMGRIFDKGLSASIRYLGANWQSNDERRCDDATYRELLSKIRRELPVEPGTTILTAAHSRLRDRGLKVIAHVASVEPRKVDGKPKAGSGYVPVADLSKCVSSAMNELTQYFERKRSISAPTILFPLIGTGNAAGDPRAISRIVAETIVDYVRTHPKVRVSRVLVSAYTNVDLDLCLEAFAALEEMGKVTPADAGAKR